MDAGASPIDPGTSLAHVVELCRILDQTAAAGDAEAVTDGLGRTMASLMDLDRWVILVRSGPDGPIVRCAPGVPRAMLDSLRRYLPWGATHRGAAPIVVADTSASRQSAPPGSPLRVLAEHGTRSALWVPLERRGRVFGELFLARPAPDAFGDVEVDLATAVASHASHAIWRSRAEAERTETLRRFDAERSVLEAVVHHMPVGIILADAPSGRVILTNRQVDAIWGRSLTDTADVDGYARWSGSDPGGGEIPAERWPLARSVLKGESVPAEDLKIRRADGSRAVIRMGAAPVTDPRGRQLAAVATVVDVTEEREREARQAFLEDVSALVNASIELDSTLQALASAVVGPFVDWCVIYRLGDGGVIERVAAAHRDPGLRDAVAVFSQGGLPPNADHPVVRVIGDGEPRLIPDVSLDLPLRYLGQDTPEAREAAERLGAASVMILPLMARGTAMGALSLVRESRDAEPYGPRDLELAVEIARRAALAIENALLYEKARSADRAKARFLAVMSHEFRTPLSAILGYSEILTTRLHGELTDKQAEHLQRIQASVRHLSHLVDEILSFASMEAGKERVSRSRLDSRSLVSDVADIMAPMAEAAGLAMTVRIPEHELVVTADAAKVRQVLINLVSNAIKYTQEGSVRVDLMRDDQYARCRVRDTGPGIAPEHVERVFEPFWQVDRPAGAQVTGSGLGLAVARRLARLMGGDVLLDSVPGQGSTFTLLLPLERGPVADDSVG